MSAFADDVEGRHNILGGRITKVTNTLGTAKACSGECASDHEHFLNIGRMRKVQVPRGSWGWAADLGLIDQASLDDMRDMSPGRPMRSVSMRGIIMSKYGGGPEATIDTENEW